MSLATARPRPAQVTDDLAFNWRALGLFGELGTRWYNHVLLWWSVFVIGVLALAAAFSGLWL